MPMGTIFSQWNIGSAIGGCINLMIDYLVDLIYHTEGTASDVLQCHKVQHSGHTPLSAALTMSVKNMEVIIVTELDPYLNTVFTEILQ